MELNDFILTNAFINNNGFVFDVLEPLSQS